MTVKFKYAGHMAEYDRIDELIERLENLAFQAELSFWDMARAEWRAQRYVSHGPYFVAHTLCSGCTDLVVEILERLAAICDETPPDGTWISNFEDNEKTLYAGSKDLELEVELPERISQPSVSGIQGVVVSESVTQTPEYAPDERKPRIATAKAVTTGLRQKIQWMRNYFWNAHNSDMWDAYADALTPIYSFAEDLIQCIGPNFAVPFTSFYSLDDVGESYYDRPRVAAVIERDTNDYLRIGCQNIWQETDPVSSLAAPTGYDAPISIAFSELKADDLVHIVKLECSGYEDYTDRIFPVSGIDANQVSFLLPGTYESLLQVMSDPAHEFGDRFLLRKVQGG